VAQTGLELMILLPLFPKCCDYRCEPPCSASIDLQLSCKETIVFPQLSGIETMILAIERRTLQYPHVKTKNQEENIQKKILHSLYHVQNELKIEGRSLKRIKHTG
jgi:hypothetical protein